MKNFLLQLAEHKSLSENEMKAAFGMILGEEASESEIAAFLMGLKSKGETVEEITGIVRALKENTLSFKKGFQMSWIIAELAGMDHRVLI